MLTRVLLLAFGILMLSSKVSLTEIEKVRGSGASFPRGVLQGWASAFQSQDDSISVQYVDNSSTEGLEDLMQGKVVFAGTEIIPSDSDFASFPDLQMMPFIAGAFVPISPSFPDLVLSIELLADILMGDIEFWDNPRIVAANPAINFPHEAIPIIYRSEQSGITKVFTTALSKFNVKWAEKYGSTAEWPLELQEQTEKYFPASGNDATATSASIIPYSIGYTSFEYLRNTRSSKLHVKLINEYDKTITCNKESIQAAIQGAKFTEIFTSDVTNSNNEGSWPIVSYSYIAVLSKNTSIDMCDEFWNAVRYMNFALTFHAPEILIESNGFAFVGNETKDKILALFRTFECNGVRRFESGISLRVDSTPSYYYFSPSSFSPITTVNYQPYYNLVGDTIESSEAREYKPSAISSLYSSDIVFQRFYNYGEEVSSGTSKLTVRGFSLVFCAIFFFSLFCHRFPALYFVLIIFVSSISCVGAAETKIRIAGLFPISGELSEFGAACEAVTDVAVQQLNEGYLNGTNTSIVYHPFDTVSTPSKGLEAFKIASDEFDVFGILGCLDDITSSTVAVSSTLSVLPQISYGSQANFLTSNAEEYPLFARVVPSYGSEGKAIASLIETYGWKNVGVIFTGDDYGVGTSSRFREHLSDQIRVIETEFIPGNLTLDAQFQILRNSLVRVIVIFPGSIEDARTILTEAYRYHLIGEDFVWFSGSFASQSDLFYDEITKETNELIKGITIGVTSVKLKGGYGERFDEFLDLWESLDPKRYARAGKRTIPIYAPYAYDAMELFARSFVETKFSTIREFAQIVRNTNFTGLTGRVAMNGIGDRFAIYDVVNLIDTNEGDHGWVSIGSWEEEFDMNASLGFEFTRNIHFYDGTTNVPDPEVRPAVEYWSCSEGIMKIDETGKIKLDSPGPDANHIASKYHCDTFIDCKNFSDESYGGCGSSNYLALFISFGILTGILVLVTFLMIVFTVLFGYIILRIRVRLASPPFLLIITVSIMLGFLSIYAWFGQPHKVACVFQPWLLGLAVNSMIAALTAKNLRIYRIFKAPLKRTTMRDYEVLAVWLIMMAPSILILFVWTLVSTPTAGLIAQDDGDKHWICETGGFTGPPGGLIFFSIFVAYTTIILIMGAIVSFITRHVPSKFNESRLIAFSIYNLLFLGVIVIPTYFVLEPFNAFAAWIIRSIAILYGFSATLILIFFPKIWGLIKDKGKNPSNVLISTGRSSDNNKETPQSNLSTV